MFSFHILDVQQSKVCNFWAFRVPFKDKSSDFAKICSNSLLIQKQILDGNKMQQTKHLLVKLFLREVQLDQLVSKQTIFKQ